MRFVHLADCHLGGWRMDELTRLNFESFKEALDFAIQGKVDFILVAGDLFDSAYPSIDILKETFFNFKRVKDAGIPIYLIPGSHDFSVSGKSFLDVLEKAGFCVNVAKWEENEKGIKLLPTFHGDVAIYGYPGKKSGMEVGDLERVYFDSVYPFSIFMLHTTLKDVAGNIPMNSLDKSKLPLANYYALGHIHQIFDKEEGNSIFVYPGPIFPNNFQELYDLGGGSFEYVEVERGIIKRKNIKIPTKEILRIRVEIKNALGAFDEILAELDKRNLNDKIVLLKLYGVVEEGKIGDIDFSKIEEFARKKGAYSFLRNTAELRTKDSEFDTHQVYNDLGQVEESVVMDFLKDNQSEFNKYLPQLLNALLLEKKEDEKIDVFEKRLVEEIKEILNLSGDLQ